MVIRLGMIAASKQGISWTTQAVRSQRAAGSTPKFDALEDCPHLFMASRNAVVIASRRIIGGPYAQLDTTPHAPYIRINCERKRAARNSHPRRSTQGSRAVGNISTEWNERSIMTVRSSDTPRVRSLQAPGPDSCI
jgi:hypothetical protein